VSTREASYQTLAEAIEGLDRRDFTEHFAVVGGSLRALQSGTTFRADQVVIREYHRFEGVSDPDDMSIVYALEGRDGTRGTLVDAFGVYANPAVSAFLSGVPIRIPARARIEGPSPAAPR
jgi:hypothetical protein